MIGVYRSATHNVLIGAALLVSGLLAVQVERNESRTWQVPVLGALELVLVIRAGRRAVVVSHLGLEGAACSLRGVLRGARLSRSVSATGIGADVAAPGRLTITLHDGHVHDARLGQSRRGDPALGVPGVLAPGLIERALDVGVDGGLAHRTIGWEVRECEGPGVRGCSAT